MSELDIRKLAQLMGELGLTGLEFRTAGDTIRLERNVSTAPVIAPASVPSSGRTRPGRTPPPKT